MFPFRVAYADLIGFSTERNTTIFFYLEDSTLYTPGWRWLSQYGDGSAIIILTYRTVQRKKKTWISQINFCILQIWLTLNCKDSEISLELNISTMT